ncbi:shikimate kinase [Variovorax sp. J22R115]|uniref:shikimate kinase n=1 Tax=Variovorax sp. J22R115 TaxID=3053509 RepID=UPI00257613B2|nr:shikimate kinase [Variovorax sp. J22R115]MDM0051914.1 shikimate kinase [Variovorax sp. J22R115]
MTSGKPIILIGLPGSGKSSIGRRLGRELDLPFLDSDTVIEERIACSIRDYFEREGEVSFRDIEQSVISELVATHCGVLATGGGAILRDINRRTLREGGHVVYLRSSPEDLFRRLRHDVKRPLLQVDDPLGRLRQLYDVRDPLYRETAHEVIDTGRPTLVMSVNLVVAQLELAGIIPSSPQARPPE